MPSSKTPVLDHQTLMIGWTASSNYFWFPDKLQLFYKE